MNKTYTYEEVRDASIAYFDGDTLAADVFAGKYALQDLEGKLYELTPADMHRRLASEFARIEAKYKNPMTESEIFDLLSSWKVVAQGSPMAAIGNTFQVQSLSNCFVIESPYDSYGGILKTDQEQIQIMKRRGGIGFDISTIRPKNVSVSNAARTTDGVGIFMERFSNTCREVAQGGRRGALMLTISVHSPEVLTFANIKRDRQKVTGANVSIRVTDEFMQAVKDGTKYQQRFPVDKDVPHLIENWVDAREVWNNIISAMRDCSEPGLLFWDTITTMSPADAYAKFGYKTIATNPCGEIVLSAYDACRLLLVNLSKFVINPFTPSSFFDYESFSETVQKSQRLMDDLVDLELEVIEKIIKKVENDPEPDEVKHVELNLWKKVKNATTNGRRTGLGITALGDVFAKMGFKYGSIESVDITDKIYKALAINSYKSSVIMASERLAFNVFDHDLEKDHPFICRVMNEDASLQTLYKKHGRRNIALNTTAPAGSVSILTQTTSGCEPVLFVSATRKRKINPSDKLSVVSEIDKMGDKWQHYETYHHGVKEWMKITGETDVKKSPYFGSTVEEIDSMKKVEIQAAAQKWIDHSISVTNNLPNDVTIDNVSDLCMHAWETKCKGVTIYRIGSRDAVITKTVELQPENLTDIVETQAPKRLKELDCDINRASVQGEQYLVIVGLVNGRPYEVFAGLQEHVEVPRKVKKGILVKNGKNKLGVATYNLKIQINDDDDHLIFKDVVNLFDNPLYGALTRTISLALRHGVPVHHLVEQLRKDKHSDLQSFSSVVARVLKNYIKDGTTATVEKTCGNEECTSPQMIYQQGCVQCVSCGWSRCN